MSDRAAVLASLARVVAASPSDEPLTRRMCRACVAILGVEGGSITLSYDTPQRITLCATDDLAERLDDLQEVIGEGPSYWAYAQGQQVHTEVDGGADARWPQFAEAVKREIGSMCIYAVPIIPGAEVIGVSTFYRRDRADLLLDPDTRRLLINAVGVALLGDPALTATADESQSWTGRAEVSQATGMVMAQLRLAPADALALLRAHAYAQSTSLSEVSAAVVTRRLDFTATD
ncbi:MAG: ANTAR domain-containing protein [Microlunatus sp.]|nr:ANTAR domain-containing protein [Microlunatus sp.]